MKKNKQPPASPPVHSRRRFIKNAAMAAVTGSALTSELAQPATVAAERQPERCVEPVAPLQNVAGKVAFVTGGSSGIGLGIARAFVAAGMKVAIGYRTRSHIDDAMRYFKGAQDRVLAIDVDVTDRTGMRRAAEETERAFGRVHVLVNNAGVVQHAPLEGATYDDWDWHINVNLNGVFNGVHEFLPRILEHKEGGHIISTSSILGLFTSTHSAIYSATKYAVVGMMESLRPELALQNVGVSVCCPGVVASSIQDSVRNRPSSLANTGFKSDPRMYALEKQIRTDPERAMDPLEAGELILRGMRNNDLYILTHPEYESVLTDRHEALLASIPKDRQPTKKQIAMVSSGFGTSVYTKERDKKRCRGSNIQTRK